MKANLKGAVMVLAGVLAIAIVVMAALYLDIAGYLATGSKTFEPDNTTIGKAIIVYSPGWTGLTWTAVDDVAMRLSDRGYEVEAAGVCSAQAQNLSGYGLVVLASPNYGKRPTDRAGAVIESMRPDKGAKIGVICTNAGNTTQGLDAMKGRIEGRGMTVKAVMNVAWFGQQPDGTAFVDEMLSE